MVALVALLAQQESLGHQLNAFGFVGVFRVAGHAAAFGLDGDGVGVGGGDEVELGGEAKGVAAEGDRAGDGGRLVAWLFFLFFGYRSGVAGVVGGIWQDVVELVGASVDVAALDGEGVVGPAWA